MVLRLSAVLLLSFCLLAACGKNIETKEQVRADLLEHLSKNAGLDVKALDIEITQLAFVNHQARATVSFRPKGVSAIGAGMEMIYTMKPEDGHWVVVGRADSTGHGMGGAPASQDLPPGHPAVDPNQLPPGHPSIDGSAPPPNDAGGAPSGPAK